MGKKRRAHAGSSPTIGVRLSHDTARSSRLADGLLGVGVSAAILLVPIAISPFGMNQFGPSKLLALSLAAFCVAASFAVDPTCLAEGMRRIARSRLAWAFVAYVGVAGLATLMSVDRLHSLVGSYPEYQGLATLMLWSVVAAGAAVLAQRENGWQRIARTTVVALIAIATVALLQKAGVPTVGGPGGWSRRAWSTIGNSSHLGVWLVLAMPFSAERFVAETSKRWRVAAGLAAGLGAVALAGSGSRGALLGFVAALVVGAILVARSSTRPERVRLALVSAGAVVLTVAISLLTQQRFARVSDFVDASQGSAGWRFIIWRTALRIVADRPVLGWGLNSMRFVYPTYRSPDALDSPITMGTVADMHNLVLNTATSMGVAGVVALLACMALTAVAVWRAAKDPGASLTAAACGASLLGFFAAVLFHYPALDSGALAAVVIGTLVSLDGQHAPITTPVAEPSTPRAATQRVWRVGTYTVSAVLLGAVVVSAGLVAADGAAARALSLAASGAPWTATRTALVQAQASAPWELAIRKTWASAGLTTLERRADDQTITDVGTALTAAEHLAPLDSSVQGARGDLMLRVARTGAKDRSLNAAEKAYRDALARDPNNAVYWAGIGSVQYARGDFTDAVQTFERVVRLAGGTPQMWAALAQAYRAAGRPADARNAERQMLDAGDGSSATRPTR